MQVDGLFSMKISQTYTMCILQRYIVMTHREHCVRLRNLSFNVEKYRYKTMQIRKFRLQYRIKIKVL